MDISVWHDRDPEYVQERVARGKRSVNRLANSDLAWNSLRIHRLQDHFTDVGRWSLVAGGGVSDGVWWGLDGAAGAARVQFGRASVPKWERRLEFEVAGVGVVRTGSSGPTMYTTPSDWLRALWLGLVTRDRLLLSVLAGFEVGWMEESIDSGMTFDPFYVEWARAWQMLLRGERGDGVAEQVVEVMRLTDPVLAPAVGREFVLQRVWPVVRLLWDVVSGNREAFGEDVRVALTAHKEYFTRPVDNRVRMAEGFVPLSIVGTVCAAVDSGFEVGVVSEYLPEGLLFERRMRALG